MNTINRGGEEKGRRRKTRMVRNDKGKEGHHFGSVILNKLLLKFVYFGAEIMLNIFLRGKRQAKQGTQGRDEGFEAGPGEAGRER